MAVKVGNVSQEVEKNEDVVAEIKQPQIVITFKQIVLCIMVIHTGLYTGLIFQIGFGWNILAMTIIQLVCTIAVYFNCWEIMLGYLIKHAYYQIRVFLEFAPEKNWFLESKRSELLAVIVAELLLTLYFFLFAKQTWFAFKVWRQRWNEKKIEKGKESEKLNVV